MIHQKIVDTVVASFDLLDLSMSLNCSSFFALITVTHQEVHVLTETMSRYGGSFCQKLAEAIRFADPQNREKILDAFPDLVTMYGPGGRFQSREMSNV